MSTRKHQVGSSRRQAVANSVRVCTSCAEPQIGIHHVSGDHTPASLQVFVARRIIFFDIWIKEDTQRANSSFEAIMERTKHFKITTVSFLKNRPTAWRNLATIEAELQCALISKSICNTKSSRISQISGVASGHFNNVHRWRKVFIDSSCCQTGEHATRKFTLLDVDAIHGAFLFLLN